jgi:hypothetical protein
MIFRLNGQSYNVQCWLADESITFSEVDANRQEKAREKLLAPMSFSLAIHLKSVKRRQITSDSQSRQGYDGGNWLRFKVAGGKLLKSSSRFRSRVPINDATHALSHARRNFIAQMCRVHSCFHPLRKSQLLPLGQATFAENTLSMAWLT